ncbi:MAG: sulfatase [Myxococcota bacterium]|jgi:arylsulfatase A-like enzyme|nr:sulfatase [Myxococcota bacterium]
MSTRTSFFCFIEPVLLAAACLYLATGLGACGTTARSDSEVSSTTLVASTPPSPSEPPAPAPNPPPIVAAPPTAARAPLDTVLDLVSSLPLFHLRSMGLLVDFGHPSRHKHTLGDWRSGWHGDYEKQGVTFSYGTGNGSTLLFDTLPSEADTSLRIVVRAKGLGSKKLRLFVDDVGLGAIDLSESEFGYAQVELKSGLKAGQHTLLLRGNGRRPTQDGTPVAFAVDYVRFEYGNGSSENAAASQDALLSPSIGPQGPGIALGPGESATINIVPPPGALLKGTARSTDGAQAQLIVTTRVDGEPVSRLAALRLGAAAKPFEASLDALGKGPVELTFSALGGGVVLGSPAISVPSAALARPSGTLSAQNLIIILIDTLRADKVKAYSASTQVKTDALSALAAQSALFERMTSAENWTKPSVASVLSGLYPSTHGAKDDKDSVPKSVVLLPEHLLALGYDTAGFVANGYVSGKFGFEQGWKKWTNYVREGKRNRAESVFDEAAAWLASRKAEKPFFLYVHTIDPHVPYFPPRRYLEMYDPSPYDGPIDGAKTADQLGHIKGKGMILNDRDKQRLEALHNGEITYHDDQLARFIAKLRLLRLLENTAIMVTADHGEEFFDHGSVGHGHSLYEELLHVPFIVRLPGAQEGKGSRTLHETTNVDIVPTACELLGQEPPAGVEGRSLVPLLRGQRLTGAPSASFSEFLSGQRSIRAGSYKAIFKAWRASVFDLQADPKETVDVAKERPIAAAMLRDLLGAHLGKNLDPVKGPRRERHRQEKVKLDAETKRQLKALGYLQD